MRLSKEVEIQIDEKTTKTYTVYEARPKDLFDIWNKATGSPDKDTGKDKDKDKNDEKAFLEILKKTLPLCSDVTIEDLKTLYPGDIEKIYNGFLEVNAPFLRVARAMNLDQFGAKLKESIMRDWLNSAARSLKPGIKTQ